MASSSHYNTHMNTQEETHIIESLNFLSKKLFLSICVRDCDIKTGITLFERIEESLDIVKGVTGKILRQIIVIKLS